MTAPVAPRVFPSPPYGAAAGIATMHHKDAILQPVLGPLGLTVRAVDADTDLLGTFSGEIERPGPPSEMVRRKCEMGAIATGGFGLGSEGTFHPHPEVPLTVAVELVGMLDPASGVLVIGRAEALAPWAVRATVVDEAGIESALRRMGFPEQRAIVVCADPAAGVAPRKNLASAEEVHDAAASVWRAGYEAVVQNDLRADRSPRRREVIRAAGEDLVRRLAASCPGCGSAGLGVDRRQPGLPCGWCGRPTLEVAVTVLSCPACGAEERVVSSGSADPGACGRCNP